MKISRRVGFGFRALCENFKEKGILVSPLSVVLPKTTSPRVSMMLFGCSNSIPDIRTKREDFKGEWCRIKAVQKAIIPIVTCSMERTA